MRGRNIIFVGEKSITKGICVRYIKEVELQEAIFERVHSDSMFYSIKYKNKNKSIDNRIIDLTESKIKVETLEKMLKNKALKEGYEDTRNIIVFCISVKNKIDKLKAYVARILELREKNRDVILLVKDYEYINKEESKVINRILNRSLEGIKKIKLFKDNEVIMLSKIKEYIVNKDLNKYILNHKNEVIKDFDEYCVKEIFCFMNKIRLSTRVKMFENVTDDIENDDIYLSQYKYIEGLKREIRNNEDKINNLINKIKDDYNIDIPKFVVKNYDEDNFNNDDKSKLTYLVKDIIKSEEDSTKTKRSIFSFNKKEGEYMDTNVDLLEKKLILESYKYKNNLVKSLERFNVLK